MEIVIYKRIVLTRKWLKDFILYLVSVYLYKFQLYFKITNWDNSYLKRFVLAWISYRKLSSRTKQVPSWRTNIPQLWIITSVLKFSNHNSWEILKQCFSFSEREIKLNALIFIFIHYTLLKYNTCIYRLYV